MIKEIAEIFYRHDPAGLGRPEPQHTDEYRLQAAMLYEDYKGQILQDEQMLRECVIEILQECVSEPVEFDISSSLMQDLSLLLLTQSPQ